MQKYLIMCRSITYAQRAQRAHERAGIYGAMTRVPVELSENGCGYGVRVSESDLAPAQRAIAAAGIRAGKTVPLGEVAR